MKKINAVVMGAVLALTTSFAFAQAGAKASAPGKPTTLPAGAPPAVGLIMPITVEAINSKSGEASKRFEWETMWVQAMRQKFGTPGPITVTSRVVHRFNQEGCARIQTIFNIHEAHVVEGALKDVRFSLNYNTCLDGQPPMESVDIREVQKLTNPEQNFTPKENGLPPIVPLDRPNDKPASK